MAAMRAAPFLFAFLGSATLSACGDVDIVGIGGAGSSSNATTAKATAATGTASGSSVTSGTTSATTGASTTGGGASEISAELLSGKFFMNCEPVVGPDPIMGSFDVEYENTGTNSGLLTVSSAALTILGPNGGTLTWAFDVGPQSSQPIGPGEKQTVTHTKVAGSGMGTPNIVNPCSLCNGTWSLAVGWSDGVTGTAATSNLGNVVCAF